MKGVVKFAKVAELAGEEKTFLQAGDRGPGMIGGWLVRKVSVRKEGRKAGCWNRFQTGG